MGKKIVEELIQKELNRERLKAEVEKILNPAVRIVMFHNYEELRKKLGEKGAAERTSKLIISSLKNN
jgi:lipid-A-disaccharide synthase